MIKLRITCMLFGLIFLYSSAYAEKKEFTIYFEDSHAEIDPNYGSNKAQLAALDSLFALLEVASDNSIQSIELRGYASPSGTAAQNKDLSEARAEAMRQLLMDRYNVRPHQVAITFTSIDWQGLRSALLEQSHPDSEALIEIIDDLPAPGEWDTRKARLMDFKAGTVWLELMRDFYAPLRRSEAMVVYTLAPVVEIDEVHEELEVPLVEEIIQEPIIEEVEEDEIVNHNYWSIHTNMLYDLGLVPNIGAEVYLGKNISLAGNWWYAWWNTKRTHYYWRTYGGYVAARYWLGSLAKEKPLTGHHLGVYGQALLYDFELGGTGYMSGRPHKSIAYRPTWAVGIEYGFSLPIKRRLNLDFTIGIGYLQGEYMKYKPIDDCYVWQSTHMRHWFGPTKLEVNLVWLLGKGNINSKKGGKQ